MGQLLSAPRPKSIAGVVHELGMVQMDPTRAVARTEHLVLFSRLGKRFRVADLERMLWEERSLFEYWAHIVPTADYPLHRSTMRRHSMQGGHSRSRYIDRWLAANASFRRYVLRELRRRGPLRTRDLEDRTVEGWRTGGWNDDGRFSAMMLEVLWSRGEVMIAGRDGQQRLWDLAERCVPVDQPALSQRAVARAIVERQLRAWGVAKTQQFGWAFDARPPGWERALAELVREGVAVPACVSDLKGDWYAHAEILERSFRPRVTLLSPFDDLISDRDHTEELFGFRFRLEIYVPKTKREFGYFVLPILHGDRLIGRIDPRFDRATGVLHVNAVFAEDGTPATTGPSVSRAIHELAAWLGARDIQFTRRMPAAWRRALRA
ncbi:MAG: crosslink repair DNA glycosylase YcaQ family protein [Actinomycetota bacterium]